jgi:hypothetical protein
MNSTLISSIAWTAWAAIITLPSPEMSTPGADLSEADLAGRGDVAFLGSDPDEGGRLFPRSPGFGYPDRRRRDVCG